jgi:hypothetical protein
MELKKHCHVKSLGKTPDPVATACALALTSVGLFVHHYLVEIETIDEGPPGFTGCMCDELFLQHFLGETTKL